MKYHPMAGTPLDQAKGGADDAARFLRDLASGQYDKQIGAVQRLLGLLGAVWPPAKLVSRALSAFVMLNRVTAPGEIVADGLGGFVSASNSRFDPKTGRFLDGPFSK